MSDSEQSTDIGKVAESLDRCLDDWRKSPNDPRVGEALVLCLNEIDIVKPN